MERLCAEHQRALDALERDVIKLDGLGALAVDGLDAEAMCALLDALFTSYRNGDLLAGRLPLVVDAGFDGITASARDAIAERLRGLDDIQVIVVSADPHTVAALRTAGANDLRWPETAAPASAGQCALHADRASAHACGQCARPACVDCLVHVPGESDLWCVGCADAMAARTLRLLRRRGA